MSTSALEPFHDDFTVDGWIDPRVKPEEPS